jgi:hypothetical protein
MAAETSHDRFTESPRSVDNAERQPGRLIDHDTRHGTDLLTAMRRYLPAAGNETIAARSGGLPGRPSTNACARSSGSAAQHDHYRAPSTAPVPSSRPGTVPGPGVRLGSP